MTIKAKLIYNGQVQPTPQDPALDFALLEIEPTVEQAPRLTQLQIKPLRLTEYLPVEQEVFYLAGYPANRSRVILPNAVVIYPHIVDKEKRDSLRQRLSTQRYANVTTEQLETSFSNSYQSHGDGNNVKFHYICKDATSPLMGLPLIGAVASTISGNSGGPACTLASGEQFGVFVGGSRYSPDPIPHGWFTHEKILPTMAIVSRLDRVLDKMPMDNTRNWREYYNVIVTDAN